MKDKLDELLKDAFEPKMAPSEELNDKILSSIQDNAQNIVKTQKREKGKRSTLMKVAVAFLGIALAMPAVVYAAEQIIEIRNAYISKNSVVMGNMEYVPEEVLEPEKEPVRKSKGKVMGTAEDKWISKEETRVGSIKGVTYEYSDYKTAMEESGLDNWFTTEYETYYEGAYGGNVVYKEAKASFFQSYEICATLKYKKGYFKVTEWKLEGSVAEDYFYSIPLDEMENPREYVNKAGAGFALVDNTKTVEGEKGPVEEESTVVIIRYGMYCGSLEFYNLSEKEIHQVLDTLTISNDSFE